MRINRILLFAAILLLICPNHAVTLQPGKNTIIVLGDPAQAAFERGRAAQAAGNGDSAIAAFREAIRLKPDFAEAHLNLGNTYSQLGRAEEALASYQECIRVSPDYAPGHYSIGVCFGIKRQWPEAIKAYREAVRLAPLIKCYNPSPYSLTNSAQELP